MDSFTYIEGKNYERLHFLKKFFPIAGGAVSLDRLQSLEGIGGCGGVVDFYVQNMYSKTHVTPYKLYFIPAGNESQVPGSKLPGTLTNAAGLLASVGLLAYAPMSC